MGHKHSREQILEGAVTAAFDEGLSQLTFGRLAKRLGINDRTIVYYFPTKEDLVADVLLTIGGRLQEVLAAAFTTTATDPVQLASAAWPILARPEIDPIFGLYFEAVGLAAAGREPYKTLVTELVRSWAVWLAGFFTGPPRRRQSAAEATIALVDGLLLVRTLAGPDAADRAAAVLGLGGRPRRGARSR